MSSTTTSTSPNGSAAPTALSHAKIVPRRSHERGHADHGWLNTYHTFAFASYQDPRHQEFGSLRVLNEDRVAPKNGFPTHPHRDFEIFSYVLSGELTHRDSIKGNARNQAGAVISKEDFYVMKRNDIQFTTGGTGIAHSEQNEHSSKWVHFLQMWVKPWSKSLPPNYHTAIFPESEKRNGFVTLISPLAAGKGASSQEEKAAKPAVEGTIPIHADFLMGAGILPPGEAFSWRVGGAGGVVSKKMDRRAYVHLPATKEGKARIKLFGKEEVELGEGDGAYVSGLKEGDELGVLSMGSEEAEVIVLDSD